MAGLTTAARQVRSPELGTQGYEHPFNDGCPARAPDGRCSIHDDRKPAMCRAVPLEPALPDGLQRVVLRRRMEEAGWMGAACIAKGEPAAANFVAMVEGRRVVQADDRAALTVLQQQMRDETRRWGRQVFELLAGELTRRVRQGALQRDGYLVLSMVPVIEVRARSSSAQCSRCARYAERQAELIEHTVARAISLGDKAHRVATGALRQFQAQYRNAQIATVAIV